jgi:hypothetical protein
MTPAQMLKQHYVASRVNFNWWNSRRKVEDAIKEQMASAVEAESDSLGANKLLYNPRLPAIKEVNALRSKITAYWEQVSNPYGDSATRLLPKADVPDFNDTMSQLRDELITKAYGVQAIRETILNDAKNRLRGAFNAGNYPVDLSALYGVEWTFPSIEPNGELPAHVYEAQKAHVQAKLEEAVALAEEAFAQELTHMVKHLADKLNSAEDGKPKVFRDSAISNLIAFFERFKKLSISSNQQLDEIVAQAQSLIQGVTPHELRKSATLKEEVRTGMADITHKLESMMIARPRRKILLPTPTSNGTH